MNKAFTLIETLIAVAIFSIITTAVFSSIVYLYKTHEKDMQMIQAVAEARRGIKVMLREIRTIDTGEDGSFSVEKASANEFIFYSDIDKDGQTERVRYFLEVENQGQLEDQCVSFSNGGSCSVNFSDFFNGTLKEAQLEVGIEGDLGWGSYESAELFVDGFKLANLCYNWGECSDCASEWQDISLFDVFDYASDNEVEILVDSSYGVNNFCDWQQNNHSIIVNAVLNWVALGANEERNFKKGVIQPVAGTYPSEQEKISIISHYVENASSGEQDYIFKYFDENGIEIGNPVDRINRTQLMEVSLLIDRFPDSPPSYYRLQTSSQLRNLKKTE
jgi:prepilin-type N-terminal cleavage/methylation domain-containing protein